MPQIIRNRIEDDRQKTMPDSPEKLPDDALIVRGGRPSLINPNRSTNVVMNIQRVILAFRCNPLPDCRFEPTRVGPTEARGRGFTTVGQIRKIGYDVVSTFGFG